MSAVTVTCAGCDITDHAPSAALSGVQYHPAAGKPLCGSCVAELFPAESNGNGRHNTVEAEVVAKPDPRATVATTTPTADRYAGRIVDLDALLAQPPQPIPWRVHDIVADGTLTIVSGESGAGKSWLAQALCTGVARGEGVAGLACAKGTALYVDAEMGPRMFVDQRLRPTGVTRAEFIYADAMGLDISKPDDLVWLGGTIEKFGANYVVIDSLRRLTPSKSENDSDDMAPAIGALAKLARDTNAAIVLVHHKGDSEKFFRGSTAIKDQCDALFALLRDPDDEAAPRRLRCRGGKGKMRYSPEPPDVFLTLDPEAGGVAAADAPGVAEPVRDTIRSLITLALPAQTKTDAARKVGRRLDDRGFREAWAELEAAGDIEHVDSMWKVVARNPLEGVVAIPGPRGSGGHHPDLRLVDDDGPGVA